jgi:hypothetical protein
MVQARNKRHFDIGGIVSVRVGRRDNQLLGDTRVALNHLLGAIECT